SDGVGQAGWAIGARSMHLPQWTQIAIVATLTLGQSKGLPAGAKFRCEHDEQVYAVAFSPDGKLVASGGPAKAIALWDAGTGKKMRETEGLGKPLKRM